MPGADVAIGMDPAASEFYKDGKYHLKADGLTLTSQQMVDMYASWVDKYPIVSIEDGMSEHRLGRLEDADRPFGQDNPAGRRRRVCDQHQNPARRHQAGIANSILIKVNQIGTLTETFAAIEMAKRAGYTAVISHRSGETEDSTIADLAVGDQCHADQDRFAVAVPTAWRSTTNCCASKKISVTALPIPVARLITS